MMRVVSWNIELGLDIAQAADDLSSLPELQNADIVLLQEMSGEGTAKLAAHLGVDYRYSFPALHPVTGLPFGNAVLSPWSMTDTDSTFLPHTARLKGQPRSATSTVVNVRGTEITTFSVHLETVLLSLRRRAAQIDALSSTAKELSSPHVLVGGDFNSASLRSIRRFDRGLAQAGLKRVSDQSAETFRRFGRPFSLDHLYTKGLTAADTGVASRATASDHLPVWATFELPGATSQGDTPQKDTP